MCEHNHILLQAAHSEGVQVSAGGTIWFLARFVVDCLLLLLPCCCCCCAPHATLLCAGPVMTGWGSRMPAQCVGGRSAFTKVISTVFVARVHCTKLIHLLFSLVLHTANHADMYTLSRCCQQDLKIGQPLVCCAYNTPACTRLLLVAGTHVQVKEVYNCYIRISVYALHTCRVYSV
jgi:hypothetical protein